MAKSKDEIIHEYLREMARRGGKVSARKLTGTPYVWPRARADSEAYPRGATRVGSAATRVVPRAGSAGKAVK
jgi:hypothetical protein